MNTRNEASGERKPEVDEGEHLRMAQEYTATKGIDAFANVVSNIRLLRDLMAPEALDTRLIASRLVSSHAQAKRDFVRFWRHSRLVDEWLVGHVGKPVGKGVCHCQPFLFLFG